MYLCGSKFYDQFTINCNIGQCNRCCIRLSFYIGPGNTALIFFSCSEFKTSLIANIQVKKSVFQSRNEILSGKINNSNQDKSNFPSTQSCINVQVIATVLIDEAHEYVSAITCIIQLAIIAWGPCSCLF